MRRRHRVAWFIFASPFLFTSCLMSSICFNTSMSTPLLGGNHQVKRMSQVQHGSFIRSFFSTHPMNAVKASTTGLNGLRNKLSIMSARATSHKKHYLLVYSKYSPHMMDSPSHDYGTPPPQSLLPTPQTQDMSLFDFEGSTNHFKSLVISDDERFSDGLNVWEFTPTQTAEVVDFSLTQLANNSSAEDIEGMILPYQRQRWMVLPIVPC